jgi:hypothetical protein
MNDVELYAYDDNALNKIAKREFERWLRANGHGDPTGPEREALHRRYLAAQMAYLFPKAYTGPAVESEIVDGLRVYPRVEAILKAADELSWIEQKALKARFLERWHIWPTIVEDAVRGGGVRSGSSKGGQATSRELGKRKIIRDKWNEIQREKPGLPITATRNHIRTQTGASMRTIVTHTKDLATKLKSRPA